MYNHIPFNHNMHISHIYSHPTGTNLWVGDEDAARDLLLLKRLNITAVLTAADGINLQYNTNNTGNKDNGKSSGTGFRDGNGNTGEIQHLVIRALDMPSYRIRQHFGETNKFIYENLVKGRNVLVHCAAGISRSVTIVIAFLIRKLNFTFKSALVHIQNRRPSACPNYGFVDQLKTYQSTVQQKLQKSRNHTQTSHTNLPQQPHHNNQISLLLQRKRQQQKQKLNSAFQSQHYHSQSYNKNSMNLIQNRNRHVSSYERSYRVEDGGVDREKERKGVKGNSYLNSARNQKSQKKQKNQRNQRYERNQKMRKRIDTENTILFPRIVLVRKLEEMDKKN